MGLRQDLVCLDRHLRQEVPGSQNEDGFILVNRWNAQPPVCPRHGHFVLLPATIACHAMSNIDAWSRFCPLFGAGHSSLVTAISSHWI